MKKLDLHSIWKNKKAVGLLSFGAVLVTFGITWAFYNSELKLDNPLTTPHSGVAMVEEFNPDSSFLPGETVVKVVKFQNTGEMDLFLRVEVPSDGYLDSDEYTEGWYDNKGNYVEECETDKVIKNWTSEWESDDTNQVTWSDPIPEGDKHYRYYKKILRVGQETAPILDSITLDPSVSNDRHDIDYSDKTYKLTFNAQAVPVEYSDNMDVQNAVTSEWRIAVSNVAKAVENTAEALQWESSESGNNQ